MAYLKPNCNKVLLFVITKEFHKWPNANEKIFSNPVKKNSICGFHGQSREKLKWWSTFKNYNEQMVSDTQKFYFCSSSKAHVVLAGGAGYNQESFRFHVSQNWWGQFGVSQKINQTCQTKTLLSFVKKSKFWPYQNILKLYGNH